MHNDHCVHNDNCVHNDHCVHVNFSCACTYHNLLHSAFFIVTHYLNLTSFYLWPLMSVNYESCSDSFPFSFPYCISSLTLLKRSHAQRIKVGAIRIVVNARFSNSICTNLIVCMMTSVRNVCM